MAITLTVSQVRQALWKSGGTQSAGGGAASTPELGTLFHQVLAGLLADNSPCSVSTIVRDLDPELEIWKSTVVARVYDNLLGPLLTQQAAAQHGKGQQVLDLWTAVQSACDLLTELWWEITARGTRPESQGDWFSAERQVVREFLEPGWKEPVAVVGQIDAVLRIPQQAKTCLLEWKLGRTSPELDLAQAALYRLLLDGDSGAAAQSAVAVVGFLPLKHERLFTAQQLAASRQGLIDVIYRLAVGAKGETGSTLTRNNGGGHDSGGSGEGDDSADEEWLRTTQEAILKTFRTYGAPCKEIRKPIVGSAYVRFFAVPDRGVRPNQVLNQGQNLQIPLRLDEPPQMRIADGMIGIDIARPDRKSISYSAVRAALREMKSPHGGTCIPVGKDLVGKWHWCDLADSSSAHALVVGTPGSGKTQWLRAAVASLIETNTPETLELLLIDPKQNAFQFLRESPFLSRPIVVPGDDPTDVLQDLVERMGQRNADLAAANAQSLVDYVLKTGTPMRRVVVVCDEYADLLAACPNRAAREELEKQFRRLAQVGRAPGFHVILATQQPRGTVLSTSIRALIPAKVVLRVTQPLESRIAMDETGAERLLGNGDLYYKCIGAPRRLQGLWLPTDEEQLVTFAARPVTV